MKEKIKIKIKIYKNNFRGPDFKIFCDDSLLDNIKNYQEDLYQNIYELDLEKGKHYIRLEHYNKNPKDTITELRQDVAIELEQLVFNGIKCSPIDLHENYFTITNWRYPVENKKIKNNLYFGFNGYYEYLFETPSTKYVLEKFKKYTKETFQIQDLEVSEDEFILKLKQHIKNQN
jgi:hypothetical protein